MGNGSTRLLTKAASGRYILVICLVSLAVSGLTLFSGFGLGTVLMPVMAVFFPIETAVAITAVVHFANNDFKLLLFGRQADYQVVLRFGIPASSPALQARGC